jgi:hypothetical protein
MSAEDLAETIRSLTPEEQEAVRRFIDWLKRRQASGTSAFVDAAEEFMAEHPELLERLAQ